MAGELVLAAKTYLWGLQGICRLHRIPFAASLVAQQFPPPYDLFSLQQAATALGLKSGLRNVSAAELSESPTPYIAVLAPLTFPSVVATDGGTDGNGQKPLRLAIVTKCEDGRITYFAEDKQHPVVATLESFVEQFGGKVMLCVPAAPGLKADEIDSIRQPEFGFRWFIPELLKHKEIWRDVLLASLAIQLMALATPVFTQVVIDKVIVHHTMSTLVVIAIGLIVFMVFSAAMTWVRQYLVLHTGNRIDAVLGLQVFEHLFKLPPRFFEHRPTGVLIARVHGVETIREFISGAAVTLCLDIPFLLIFLGVMFYYSWLLTLLALAILLCIAAVELLRDAAAARSLNQQFLLGARNQAFLTEYVAGMETVKSLQMEPQLSKRFGEYLAAYLAAGFNTRQLANTYNARPICSTSW